MTKINAIMPINEILSRSNIAVTDARSSDPTVDRKPRFCRGVIVVAPTARKWTELAAAARKSGLNRRSCWSGLLIDKKIPMLARASERVKATSNCGISKASRAETEVAFIALKNMVSVARAMKIAAVNALTIFGIFQYEILKPAKLNNTAKPRESSVSEESYLSSSPASASIPRKCVDHIPIPP